jgi:hypothetical protein
MFSFLNGKSAKERKEKREVLVHRPIFLDVLTGKTKAADASLLYKEGMVYFAVFFFTGFALLVYLFCVAVLVPIMFF